MAMYRVCEYCGANLDFSERCDCRDREVSADENEEATLDDAEECKSE